MESSRESAVMPDPSPLSATIPRTADLLLATFSGLYQQEVAAEEDIHRTLPFFTTALGIVVGALGYASGQMPPIPSLANPPAVASFGLSAACLGLSSLDAALGLYWLLKVLARRDHQRIGPEDVLRARLDEGRAVYAANGTPPHQMDTPLLDDMRQFLLDSYGAVTPGNRAINRSRHVFRAQAATHLVKSLMWALAATVVIFIAGKL